MKIRSTINRLCAAGRTCLQVQCVDVTCVRQGTWGAPLQDKLSGEAAKLIYNSCKKNSCSARCQLTSSWTDIHPLLNLVWPLQPRWYYTHTCMTWPLTEPEQGERISMACVWTEAEPDTNLGSTDATCEWSDSLPLFADWAATAREWQSIVVCAGETALCGRQNPSDKWVPQGLEAGPPRDNRRRNSRTRICPSLCSHHHISSTISPPACSASLLLPAVLKLKTAAWNTRLMKPCLELLLFLPAVQSRFISMEWSV